MAARPVVDGTGLATLKAALEAAIEAAEEAADTGLAVNIMATYAAMVADTVGKSARIYQVTNDEDKGLTNVLYQWTGPGGVIKWIASVED